VDTEVDGRSTMVLHYDITNTVGPPRSPHLLRVPPSFHRQSVWPLQTVSHRLGLGPQVGEFDVEVEVVPWIPAVLQGIFGEFNQAESLDDFQPQRANGLAKLERFLV